MVQLKTHNSQLKNLNNGKSKRYKIPYFDPSREAPKEILPLQKNGHSKLQRCSELQMSTLLHFCTFTRHLQRDHYS